MIACSVALDMAAWFSLSAWIYLIAFHGRFWRSLPALEKHVPASAAKVAAIVPARNEAESIARSLTSLLHQDYAGEFAIVLVDDNSTDGTAEIAASLDAGGRLSIVRGAPLPEGWSGKLWAVHQGLAHPAAKAADLLLLTDADIEHAPDHLTALVAKAQNDQLDLVSELVRLHCQTLAERALIPAFVFFFQMLYPFAWVGDPKERTAGAAGGAMLVHRTALDGMDGVSRIRGKLIDDCALAGAIKSSGGRIWLGHSERAASTRIYAHWRDVWQMIARTAYEQLGNSRLLLAGCVAGMTAIFLTPPLATLFAMGLPRLAGLGAWLTMALAMQPTLRRYRQTPLWGLALPAIAVFYLCATFASAVRYHGGRGGAWKNRVYAKGNGSVS